MIHVAIPVNIACQMVIYSVLYQALFTEATFRLYRPIRVCLPTM